MSVRNLPNSSTGDNRPVNVAIPPAQGEVSVRAWGIAKTAAALVISIGTIVWIGWTFDFAILQSILPDAVHMVPNTACSFVLSGASLWIFRQAQFTVTADKRLCQHRIARTFAWIVLMLGFAVLTQYLAGWDIGIDRIFFRSKLTTIGTSYPGRMSPITALNFMLAGLALLLADKTRFQWLFSILILVIASLSLLGIMGYALDIKLLYAFEFYSAIAIHTAVAFAILATGIFSIRSRTNSNLNVPAGFGVALFILMAVGMMMHQFVLEFIETANQRRQVHDTLITLNDLVGKIVDAETGQRGYVITGENSFLEPYLRVIQTIPSDFEKLKTLSVHDTAFVQHMQQLDALIADKVNLLARNIRLRQEEGFEAAASTILEGKGRRTMDDIRSIAAVIAENQNAFLSQRDKKMKKLAQWTLYLVVTGSILSFSIVGFVFYFLNREINMRKQAEKNLQFQKQQLEAMNEELEAFSYSVSHDLRAPLRYVAGFVELFKKHCGPQVSEKGLHYLKNISDSVQQMGFLIDDLLSFSRMGRTPINLSSVALQPLAESVRDSIGPESQNRKVVWDIRDLPLVRADPTMMRLVLTNLFSNAVKYTRFCEESRIEVGTTPSYNGEVVVFVRDNGAGFDMEYAHKLFGVFQRLHRSEDFEGTGIGLANVRRIINRHGGKTWAEGTVGVGATFYFSLPK